MKRKTFYSILPFLFFAFTLLGGKQISAQNQDDCFDFSGPAFLAGLWFADGETLFNSKRTIDGNVYHKARIWAGGEYRLQLIEAFEAGIPGIRFFPAENRAQNQPKNMFFWVNSKGPFKDYDPENSKKVIVAPAQFVDTRSEILSWMMGLIYGEGWRTGTIMDDAKSVGIERAQKAKELLERAGFETVSIQEKPRKYRLFISSSEFPKVLALPFRRWTRVPGNGGRSEPPSNVDPYPSCTDEETDEGLDDEIVGEIDAKFDVSRNNRPGTIARIDVLDNDILSDGSVASFDKIKFDLNPDTPKLETWFGTDTYSWRINESGQLAFKPKSGFDGEPVSIRYKVIEVATGASDVVYAKVTYDMDQAPRATSNTFLHANPVTQGQPLQFSLPEDSDVTNCRVFNWSGQLVDQFTVFGNSGTYKTDRLSRGKYILTIYLAKKTETIQFIVD